MLTDEPLLPALAAIERVTGQRPHPTTLHRWFRHGTHGVKLETLLCGGRRMSSVLAVKRFFEAVTAASDGVAAPASRTNRQRESAIAKAEAELAKAGI